MKNKQPKRGGAGRGQGRHKKDYPRDHIHKLVPAEIKPDLIILINERIDEFEKKNFHLYKSEQVKCRVLPK